MLILGLIGLIVTVVVWRNYGPVWGLVTGFLLIGGLGWKLIASLLGLFVALFSRGSKEFVAAWERQVGEMEFVRPQTDPPSGMYRDWKRANKATGVPADDWIADVLLAAKEPDLVRHVELSADGKGATFEMRLRPNGTPDWKWSYDSGLRDDFNTYVMTEVAITTMEKEQGLPLTFPHLDPDRKREPPKKRTPEEEAEFRSRLEERAAGGDPLAIAHVWELNGTPIVDPTGLVEDDIYRISLDLGIYRGSITGRRWEDHPEFDDEPEIKEWFTFEAAEGKGDAGVRLSIEDFQPRKRSDGTVDHNVVRLPVSQAEARQVFQRLRDEYREREKRRGPDRFSSRTEG